MFDLESLKAQVEKVIATDLRTGKQNALVAFVNSTGDAEFRFVRRVGDTVKIGAIVKREKNVFGKYGWSEGVFVQASW